LAVGLGVGIPVFLAIVGAIAFFVKKSQKSKNDHKAHEMGPEGEKQRIEMPVDFKRHEAPAEVPVYGADGRWPPMELSSERISRSG
jgi:hypothetical protein